MGTADDTRRCDGAAVLQLYVAQQVRGLDADAADDRAVPGSRRIAVGLRIKPQHATSLCDIVLCPAMSRAPLDGSSG